MRLKFRVFRAIDEYDTCLEYIRGHVEVLKDYGITNITSNKNSWITNPSIYCIVAETPESNEIIGGIRIQIVDGIHPLPVEEAVGSMDSRIYDKVKMYSDVGAGELCGLWNSKKVAGRGISIFLVRAAISIIDKLNFKILIGICAEYTLDMFTRVGFVVDNSLGNNGEFVYPNSNYIARVLGILNAETLETAHEYDKQVMLQLRKNPVQVRMEPCKTGVIEIDYNLLVPKNQNNT